MDIKTCAIKHKHFLTLYFRFLMILRDIKTVLSKETEVLNKNLANGETIIRRILRIFCQSNKNLQKVFCEFVSDQEFNVECLRLCKEYILDSMDSYDSVQKKVVFSFANDKHYFPGLTEKLAKRIYEINKEVVSLVNENAELLEKLEKTRNRIRELSEKLRLIVDKY